MEIEFDCESLPLEIEIPEGVEWETDIPTGSIHCRIELKKFLTDLDFSHLQNLQISSPATLPQIPVPDAETGETKEYWAVVPIVISEHFQPKAPPKFHFGQLVSFVDDTQNYPYVILACSWDRANNGWDYIVKCTHPDFRRLGEMQAPEHKLKASAEGEEQQMLFSELEEGDGVFVCVRTQKEQILRFKGIISQVIGERINMTVWLDEPRGFYFERSSGKQIGDDGFWLERKPADES